MVGFWCVIGVLGGCGDGGADDTSGTDTVATTGTDSASTTGTVPTTTESTPTEGDTEAGGGECDPLLQDCPEGAKCTAYGKLPGDAWDANKCVPETGNAQAGDPCEVEGSDMFTGIDNCARGFICLNTDSNGKDGACVEMCGEGETCPVTGTFCVPANEGVLPICPPMCDPLLQDCGGTQGCVGDPELPFFVCFNPDPQDGGQDGSSCDFTNGCLPGLHCAQAATQEGCITDGFGCCTPFCDLTDPDCTGNEVCSAFFPDPQPGFEDVGICVLPG